MSPPTPTPTPVPTAALSSPATPIRGRGRLRWKILSSAILKTTTEKRRRTDGDSGDSDVHQAEARRAHQPEDDSPAIRFPSYGLFEFHRLQDDDDEHLSEDASSAKSGSDRASAGRPRRWFQATAPNEADLTFKICLLRPDFSTRDLMGFNNTGNVCVWPSEECLAIYCLENLQRFAGRDVIELGGGMTSLAGLTLTRAGAPRRVVLTDGHPASVDNLDRILKVNPALRPVVAARTLRWNGGDSDDDALRCQFDFVLAADCLFFDEFRQDLADCMWRLLRPAGRAVVVAPRRGSTFDDFVRLATDKGRFRVVTRSGNYSERVSKRRKELLLATRNGSKMESEKEVFDENAHFPVLVELEKISGEKINGAGKCKL